MKDDLRSASLLILLFFLFATISVGLAVAPVDGFDPLKFNSLNQTLDPPKSYYPVWGYVGKEYYFNVNYPVSNESKENKTMVFYVNKNETIKTMQINSSNTTYVCNYTRNETCKYLIFAGVFIGKENTSENWSSKLPIKIINKTNISVQDFSMLEENEGFNTSSNSLRYNVINLISSGNNSSKYCGYVENDYTFSVILNGTSISSQESEDNRTISETTTIVDWDDNNFDDSMLNNLSKANNISSVNSSDNNIKFIYIIWSENFTHDWSKTGEKNISSTYFYWDPLDGNNTKSCCENGSSCKNCLNNTSILIIRDPKNFFSLPKSNIILTVISLITKPFSNMQHVGIFLLAAGLMILFYTYRKNNVPVKISFFSLKPLDLGSVDFFIGIFDFVAGMYLYFVFGRCPWEIPLLDMSSYLSDAYFSMLYYEYQILPSQHQEIDGNAIPFLSIILCLTVVTALSFIIYWFGKPILNKLKSVKYLITEGTSIIRLSIYGFYTRFKKAFIQIEKSIRRIILSSGKVNDLKCESGKKEKI